VSFPYNGSVPDRYWISWRHAAERFR